MEAHATHGTAEDDREPPAGSPGIHTVLDVLEVLAVGAPASLAELTHRLGSAKTTVYRVCGALVDRDWIVRDPRTAEYSLGVRALEVGASAAEIPIVVAFRPVAAYLVSLHNETVHLTVLDGGDSLFIAKAETTHAVRLVSAIGTRLPAFASASGRVLLADLPGEAIEIAYAAAAGDADRPRPRRVRGARAILAQVREAGSRRTSRRPRSGSTASRCRSATVAAGRSRR